MTGDRYAGDTCTSTVTHRGELLQCTKPAGHDLRHAAITPDGGVTYWTDSDGRQP